MIRLTAILILSLAFTTWSDCAWSFWGKENADPVSGLDFSRGYDINTVTTISGKVTVPPERRNQGDLAMMTVAAPVGDVQVILGPWWFWEQQKLAVGENVAVTVTGSRAQGKNGGIYVFAQSLETGSNETVQLRTESGEPLWSGGAHARQSSQRLRQQSGTPGGVGTRGSGRGMRGGRR